MYYHITVIDTSFNVTFVYNIYYEMIDGSYITVNDANSPLINDLIVISTTNYKVSKNNVEVEVGGILINDVSLYPTFDKLEDVQTHSNMFYVSNILNLSYRFGRNKNGFYQFKLNLPKGYQYDIYLGTSINDLSIGDPSWEASNKLNSLTNYIIGTNEKETGYYYYINGSTRLRTRYFTIIISNDDINDDWGLSDKG